MPRKDFTYWVPRIIALLFILLLGLISLDSFGSNGSFSENMRNILYANVKSLILIIILIIAWRYEFTGGVLFVLAGFFYFLYTVLDEGVSQELLFSKTVVISAPSIIIGALFIISWSKRIRSNAAIEYRD